MLTFNQSLTKRFLDANGEVIISDHILGSATADSEMHGDTPFTSTTFTSSSNRGGRPSMYMVTRVLWQPGHVLHPERVPSWNRHTCATRAWDCG